MATVVKRIIKSIIWAGVAYTMISMVWANILITMALYYEHGIPDSVHYDLALIAVILQDIAIFTFPLVFWLLDSRGMLPELHIREENIRKYPALLLSLKSLMKGVLWWLALGLLPFLVYIVILTFTVHDRIPVFIPGGTLYMELAFVYILYKKLKVTV